MENMDKRLYTHRELIEHGNRCANYVLQGMNKGIVHCMSWTAVVVGLYLFLTADAVSSNLSKKN